MESTVVYPKFRWFIFLALVGAWFNFGVIVLAFAPLCPAMSQEFGVKIGTLVIGLLAINSVARTIGAMACGPLIDRFGPRKVLLGSSLLVLVYCILIPVFSHSFSQLVALRIYEGLVDAPYFATMAVLAQRWFPKNERGTVIGVNNGMMAVGTGTLYLMFPLLMQYFHDNWRMVAASSGVLVAFQVILAMITLLGKEPAEAWSVPSSNVSVPSSNVSISKDWATALGLPILWIGGLLSGVGQSCLQSIAAVTPSYLMTPPPAGLGLQAIATGLPLSLIQVGMITAGALNGFFLRYIFRGSARWLAAAGFLSAGLVIYALSTSFAHNNLSLFFFVAGALMNIGIPTVSVFISVNYPPHIMGKVFGVTSSIAFLCGAVYSGVSGGILNQTNNYAAVFGSLLIVSIVGFVLAGTMLRPIRAFETGRKSTNVVPVSETSSTLL